MSNKVLFNAGSSFCGDSGLLTAAGAETVYDTTVIIPFCIDGVMYRKAAVTDGTMVLVDHNGTTLTTLAASEGCVLLFLLNAAGAVSVMQSDVETLDDSDAYKTSPNFGPVPDGTVPFATMLLTNAAAGSAFVIGTDDWNQTGMTVSIENLGFLPDRPRDS